MRKRKYVNIEVVPIPITEIQLKRSVISQPVMPIPTEDDEIPEDETIESTVLTWDEWPLPPVPHEEDAWQIPLEDVDEKPFPAGGYAALKRHLVYPEIARIAGVEGLVVIDVHFNRAGDVIETKIIKSLGPNGCDEAAIQAIHSVSWCPAYKENKPVAVWMQIHFQFQLK